MPPTVRPLTPAALAALVVAAAAERLGEARERGVAVRVGVDGALAADTGPLADLVADHALATGVGALRVRARDFLHRRSVRLEHGPADVDAAYERAVDWAALQREVLEPLGDPARLTWLPRLRDPDTDRAAREPVRTAGPGALLVVDGPYLLRWELTGDLDVVVHLQTSDAALRRRVPDGDPAPGAWARYVGETAPAERADLVVRAEHPDRPALVTPG
ncbi:uridine kinase [Aquipuribacter nitratireducens]|uniref:Uridine kinase n=1 Tax=Aquipuribacter nitratireducens TaxID=650104 RepID=A0ABW0GRZ9_9MICO